LAVGISAAVAAARCEEGAEDENGDVAALGGRKLRRGDHDHDRGVPKEHDDDQDGGDYDAGYPAGYSEPERFARALEYHRALLFDYTRRWERSAAAAAASATVQHLPPPRHQQHRNNTNGSDSSGSNGKQPPPGEESAAADSDKGAGAAMDAASPGGSAAESEAGSPARPPASSTAWPRHVPDAADVPALEFDLRFCLRSVRNRPPRPSNPSPAALSSHPYRSGAAAATSASSSPSSSSAAPAAAPDPRRLCQDLRFRIASFYLAQAADPERQREGHRAVRSLAEEGHPDGMCLYGAWESGELILNGRIANGFFVVGIAHASNHSLSSLDLDVLRPLDRFFLLEIAGMILMDGPDRVPGAPRRPRDAVRWLRRAAAAEPPHIPATYELAAAHYTGDGMPAPDPAGAVRLFRRAAHLGHPGAAYMLGECLLDGVGCERDRASALEWLLTAAELGHGLARERALMVLLDEHDNLAGSEGVAAGQDGNCDPEITRRDEAAKWLDGQSEETLVNLERRHTIGAGGIKAPTKSAAVRERRKSKVRDSRDEGHHVVFLPPGPPQDVGRGGENPSPES
jgi:TPR repeat protein